MSKILNREEILDQLSGLYIKFLSRIDWSDPVYLKGIHEGKNKFLSNAYLHLCAGKYSITNFHSPASLALINKSIKNEKKGRLVFEHMVPKEKYIQKPSEEIIQNSSLSFGEKSQKVRELLEKYWFIASITSEEDKSIKYKRVMPPNWDEVTITSRYDEVGIVLVPNEIWG